MRAELGVGRWQFARQRRRSSGSNANGSGRAGDNVSGSGSEICGGLHLFGSRWAQGLWPGATAQGVPTVIVAAGSASSVARLGAAANLGRQRERDCQVQQDRASAGAEARGVESVGKSSIRGSWDSGVKGNSGSGRCSVSIRFRIRGRVRGRQRQSSSGHGGVSGAGNRGYEAASGQRFQIEQRRQKQHYRVAAAEA